MKTYLMTLAIVIALAHCSSEAEVDTGWQGSGWQGSEYDAGVDAADDADAGDDADADERDGSVDAGCSKLDGCDGG